MEFLVRFLHQTTTAVGCTCHRNMLYIVRFLHQTTTSLSITMIGMCCISSVSYIKPQLLFISHFINICCISSVSYIKPQRFSRKDVLQFRCISSVSYIKPQRMCVSPCFNSVVYRPFPTSNHNGQSERKAQERVVYRPFPTSNHNNKGTRPKRVKLYIVRFLHQTTTALCGIRS